MTGYLAQPSTESFWTMASQTDQLYGKSRLERPPVKLILSLSKTCNLKCFHCRGTQALQGDQDLSQNASRELIDFIIKQVIPEVSSVRLGGLGVTEQLIAPEFDYFFENIDSSRLNHFQLTTNLSVMTPERAKLLAAHLTEVEASFEGVGENFQWARKMKWERFQKNFAMLRDARDANPKSRMKLSLLGCVIPEHFADFLKFEEFKKMGVDRILLREIEVISPELEQHRFSRHIDATRKFITDFKEGATVAGLDYWIGFEEQIAPAQKLEYAPCWLPFDTLTIQSDGTFGVCCKLKELTQIKKVGSTLNIMELWNRPEFRKLRAQVNSASPGRVCRRCEMKVGHLTGEDRKKLWNKTDYLGERWIDIRTKLSKLRPSPKAKDLPESRNPSSKV